MKRLISLLHVMLLIQTYDAVTVPRSPVTSPPGSDVTLSCSFSYKAGADLGKVVVTWQRRDYRVVHSFYYGQDQLALQNETYRSRTQLFPEQLSVGNASLRLKQVRGEDEGWYTCAVTNQVESTRGDVRLIVAAPYSEPHVHIDIMEGRDQYALTLYSRGYPSATVQWLNEIGCDITEHSKTSQSLDSRGLVELRSQMLEQRDENASYTFILNNTKLDQVIIRSFSVTKNTGSERSAALIARSHLPLLIPILLLVLTTTALIALKQAGVKSRAGSSP
ncbi:CD276 antigen-like [Acipenser ruthenus]|uniref:CD276 antigen-like n=1 Tax=Acipenser ruthenus TaxID=7906 RepID=UPI00274214FB|nr:CD276 antigen-like [Acipenser ruthenus]XP_058866686.1 CD276 antigen-like [Acipenser ruthenus]